uniref:G_PROTEIN_RECEP_F1_2 domain-containing protein n=1 Tax=Panagrellus redivivus TaxID=6233 RepID=A0A7E4V458_PANRE
MENITGPNIDNVTFIDTVLPFCNICLGNTDPAYQTYNIIVSGTILFLVGCIGLLGNILVVSVYSSPTQRRNSTAIYLCALGCSDFCMICTAMFLFVLEAWRHHGHPTLAYLYGMGAPLVFPLGAVFQTTSVYFCIGAAVDCFIAVVLPTACRQLCCTPKRAKLVVMVMACICCLYNIPHFLEIETVRCIGNSGVESLQICPTSIRMDPIYYTVYYTYMYTTFLAVGPLLLLIVLNICVVFTVVCKRPRGRQPVPTTDDLDDSEQFDTEADSAGDDTISLILVVFFFIFSNFTALLINFLELTLYEQLKHVIVYLVDMSNLLVVCNCTVNFFVYLTFGKTFRSTLKEILGFKPALKPLTAKSTNLVWHGETSGTNCVVVTAPTNGDV